MVTPALPGASPSRELERVVVLGPLDRCPRAVHDALLEVEEQRGTSRVERGSGPSGPLGRVLLEGGVHEPEVLQRDMGGELADREDKPLQRLGLSAVCGSQVDKKVAELRKKELDGVEGSLLVGEQDEAVGGGCERAWGVPRAPEGEKLSLDCGRHGEREREKE
eukprot:scaffold243919_cov26-Tisochrysis_lutea.AAC.4